MVRPDICLHSPRFQIAPLFSMKKSYWRSRLKLPTHHLCACCAQSLGCLSFLRICWKLISDLADFLQSMRSCRQRAAGRNRRSRWTSATGNGDIICAWSRKWLGKGCIQCWRRSAFSEGRLSGGYKKGNIADVGNGNTRGIVLIWREIKERRAVMTESNFTCMNTTGTWSRIVVDSLFIFLYICSFCNFFCWFTCSKFESFAASVL